MKEPPRSMFAPASFTRWATPTIWSQHSTEQGPAIRPKEPPPRVRPASPMGMMLSSGWNLRFTALKGSLTRVTLSTMSRLRSMSMSTFLVLPIRPRTVVYSPWETCTPRPCFFSHSISISVLSGDASCFSTAIISVYLSSIVAGIKMPHSSVTVRRNVLWISPDFTIESLSVLHITKLPLLFPKLGKVIVAGVCKTEGEEAHGSIPSCNRRFLHFSTIKQRCQVQFFRICELFSIN